MTPTEALPTWVDCSALCKTWTSRYTEDLFRREPTCLGWGDLWMYEEGGAGWGVNEYGTSYGDGFYGMDLDGDGRSRAMS